MLAFQQNQLGFNFSLIHSFCEDVDECEDLSRCAENATCSNLDGSYDCNCSAAESYLCFGM